MVKNEASKHGNILPYLLSVSVGMILWFAASYASGRREAWDADIYWVMAYPAATVLPGMAGYLFPERPWRWALALFLGQFLAMLLRNGELGSLWPLGVVFFAVLSVPGMLLARIGAWLRNKSTPE